MKPLNNPAQIIHEVKRLVDSERRSEIRLNANGGNSILIICEPLRETEYIDKLVELLPEESYSVIDLNKCLIDFVAAHKSEIDGWFEMLQSSIDEIFKAPAVEESPDLFKEIISKVETAFNKEKTPVLINTGALYGTSIDNLHIMENESVMKAGLPLIILYPATNDLNRLMFLGKRPASEYRCMTIQ